MKPSLLRLFQILVTMASPLLGLLSWFSEWRTARGNEVPEAEWDLFPYSFRIDWFVPSKEESLSGEDSIPPVSDLLGSPLNSGVSQSKGGVK